MQIQHVKMILAAVWMVAAAIVVALATGVSGVGVITFAAIGFLPPLAFLLLWSEPGPTMSESIARARR